MKRHIDLDRRFYGIDEKADAFPEDTTYYGDSDYLTDDWGKLLLRKRVIMLAEAGMGKSEELRTQAEKLSTSGRTAFYARIERLAEVEIDRALERGDEREIAEWRNGDGVAYFFLDSVDEARLTHKRFSDALTTIAQAIRGAEERAHIFISSRPSDWRWAEDLVTMKQLLPVRIAAESDEIADPTPMSDEALLVPLRERRNRRSQQDDETKPEMVSAVRLLGLSRSKIEKFANERGVADVAAFMRALDDADAMRLVARPQDLDGIIEIWKKTGRIGTHSQAMRGSIDQRLQETNLDQAELRELSEQQAMQGARRVAAALTLGHAATVAVPGAEQEREGALDVAALLPTWTPKQRKALLSRGLFDPATFGRVRFHHREVQELLGADWLLERLDQGCPQEVIEQLLLTESHGFTVVRPSLRAVAAWVGQQHEGIRERLLRDAPEILIEGGDSSLMPVAARVRLLRQFAERYRGRRDTGISINLDNVKRLVDPELASAIEELWRDHAVSEEVRELLLRLIWQGGLRQNASIADDVLRSSASAEYERRLALRALASAGLAEQRRAAVGLVVDRAEEWGTRIVAETVDAFYPDHMSDDELAALLQSGDERETQRATGLGWTLGQVAARAPLPVVERMLIVAMPLVCREPYASGHIRVSRRYEWLVDPLATMSERLLPAAGASPSDTLAEAVDLLGEHAFWRSDVHADTKGVSAALADPQLTRHFFWRSFGRGLERLRREGIAFEGYWQLQRDHRLWQLKPSDLDWLMTDVRALETPDARLAALTAALQLWSSSGRDGERQTALRTAIGTDGPLQQVLEGYVNPPPRTISAEERRLQERRDQRERERDEDRQRSEQSWLEFRDELRQNPRTLSNPEAIEARSNFGALSDISKWLRVKADNHSQYGVGEWELLEPAFGRPVAEAARDGLVAFWRTIDCEAELHSDQSTIGSIVALTGIAMDARSPNWAAVLTDEEARRATKLAFKELNGLPPWLGDVLEDKPAAGAEVLEALIANELRLEPGAPDPARVLERLSYAPPVLRDCLPPLVLHQLEEQDPRRSETLRRSLRTMLASPALDRKRLAGLARARIAAHHNDRGLQLLWLVALLCVDADAGVTELQRCINGLMQTEADVLVLNLLNTLMSTGTPRSGRRTKTTCTPARWCRC